MSVLKKLKLSDQTRSKSIAAPEVKRREKLLEKIDLQIKAAEAASKGEEYTYKAMRHVTHPETGVRSRQELSVRVRPWWWKDVAGTVYLTIKYGNRKLELQSGKPSIEIGEMKQLVPTLERVAEAVKAGELDTLINATAKNISS